VNQRTPFGVVQTQRSCDKCRGKGKIIDSPCKSCSGSGKQRKQKTLEINVPAGVADDQMLKVTGQGNAGVNGGPSGDLLLGIRVKPHPIFERRGNDIWCELPITFTQAALGDEVTVPTLDGDVSYQIHEGTQPGDVFKLKNKGVENLGGRGRGDQFVRVTIEVPRNLSKEQKELLQKLDASVTDKNHPKRKSFFDKVFKGKK
jgi:molecular chaperone DnaJ